jgi:hypothetical protein
MVLTTLLPTSKMESSVMPHYIPFSGRRSYRLRRYWWCRREDARHLWIPRAILTDDVVRQPTVVDHTLDDDDHDDDDDALHPKAKHRRLDPLGGETSTLSSNLS